MLSAIRWKNSFSSYSASSIRLRSLMSVLVPTRRMARPSILRATTMPRPIVHNQLPSLHRMRYSVAIDGASPSICAWIASITLGKSSGCTRLDHSLEVLPISSSAKPNICFQRFE